jgi:hypothetical protein
VVVPVWWEPELTGLVHAWAEGASWSELIANTSLDEGDVVRIMRRTVDLLAQVPYCEVVSEKLRRNTRMALKAINRFPVSDPQPLPDHIQICLVQIGGEAVRQLLGRSVCR